MSWPRIVCRRTMRVSPWMEIIEREVELNAGGATELYHAVAQQDYIAIVARTPDGKFRSCGNTGPPWSVHLGIAGRHGRTRRAAEDSASAN